MPTRPDDPLAALDRCILRNLQCDSLIAYRRLPTRWAFYPPACLKRVRRLRDAGIIERTVAPSSPDVPGYPLLTVMRLKLNGPRDEVIHEFEARMAAYPRVIQCLLVDGKSDYNLLVRSRDVAHYQEFARPMLRTAPGIRSHTSEVVVSVTKATAGNLWTDHIA